MRKGRLEAFSDGVIAIIITIMGLELKIPAGDDLAALRPQIPIFISYLLSFVMLSIYWNNHHHLFQAVEHVDGRVLWANMHLLFWLTLVPFTTAWMGENHFSSLPVAIYGGVLLLAAMAYFLLVHALIALHGRDSLLAAAIGGDFKGIISVLIYAVAIPLAFLLPWLSAVLFATVSAIWLIPDRRIENAIRRE